VQRCDFPDAGADPAARVLAVGASIGQMAALIGQSDDFVGYDSACQHIAAAQGIPTVTIFAGTNNSRFIRRWAACGRGSTGIVHVNTLSRPGGLDHAEIVQRVLARREAGISQ
jgi:ADP-heptose:LPS heptosyltransferase